ncbi:hypothetical protein [Marvinbryantia formatexigens]|nr:hypothetical protein [Marvinbryantia formatexigens]UWO23940.1 hypothetical protein NQ534_16055 [Marvinbryantia formatexigens DSM 14469]SDH11030.1 hypothetical protein SAMN05660368_03856 [Marvinbryantia formatexigens]
MEKRCCICETGGESLLRLSDGYICAPCAMKGNDYGMVRRRRFGKEGRYLQLDMEKAWRTHSELDTQMFFNRMRHIEIVRRALKPSRISPDGHILVDGNARYLYLNEGELFGNTYYSLCYEIKAVRAFYLDRFYEVSGTTKEKKNFFLRLVIELKDEYVPYLSYRLCATSLMYPQPYERMARFEGEQALKFLEGVTGKNASEETETWMIS